MSGTRGSFFALIETSRRGCQECLDLMTAETEEEFEKAFDSILEKAIRHLETNSRNFSPLSEEALTAVLAGTMMFTGLTVSQETNSNGHVDLTFEVPYPRLRRKLGEAKIYKGCAYHFKGLRQLVGRYSTGREEGRGIMMVYVQKSNIAGLMQKLSECMDKENPIEQAGTTTPHEFMRWAFISAHRHSSGEPLEIGHFGCNLYCERKLNDKSGVESNRKAR
jgi:hypothetical protein